MDFNNTMRYFVEDLFIDRSGGCLEFNKNSHCSDQLCMKWNAKLLLFGLLMATPGFAQELNPFCAALKLRSFFTDELSASLENRSVQFVLKTDNPKDAKNFELVLGKRLGSGFGGSVYRLEQLKSEVPEIAALANDVEKLVVKLPHTVRFSDGQLTFPHSAIMQGLEIEQYQTVFNNLDRIQTDAAFPRNAHWENRKIPVAPIVAKLETTQGILILKPEIKGMTLREIFLTHARNLPPEMEESLRNIYGFTQAVSSQTRKNFNPLDILSGNLLGTFYPDINPTNLVWINDAPTMRLLALKKPGFVLYEMAEYPGNKYHHSKMSFEAYKAEFLAAAEHEAAK